MTTERDPNISEADLVAFVDGRLDPGREADVEAWLNARPSERQRIEGWRTQTSALQSAMAPIVDEPIPPRLQALLKPRKKSWFPLATAASIAALLVGFAGGFLIWGGNASPAAREIAAVGLSAHHVYIREIRHAVEVSADDEDHLVAWLSNRVDFPIGPPDLSADGLALLGGRVVPRDGEPAALLMYEDDAGERFTLLIARASTPETTNLRYASDTDAGAYYWMGGEVGFVFVGPDDRGRLLGLTEVIYDQIGYRP